MPDASPVGRRFHAPGQVVDPERVARFAAAVAGDEPVLEPGGVPPTYAAVYCMMPTLARIFADPELGIELAGLIHVEQSFEWQATVRPGDVIDASAEITAVEQKRSLTLVSVGLEAHRGSGEPVCHGRSLLLIRGSRA